MTSPSIRASSASSAHRRRTLLLAAAPLALAVATPDRVMAQAIERNLPPAPQAAPQAILAPNMTPNSQDDHPLGPTLTGILALGAEDAVREANIVGVSTGLVGRLDTREGRDVLKPFLGRPMSRKLIAEIEAAIARYYRTDGYPFVSLSTPPQTIGGGMLQVRVVEFHDGAVKVTGSKGKAAARIRDQVRLQPGQPVNAPQLSDDLDWINRYPFHHAEALFSPGDALGRTDLDVQVTPSKPWLVYGGYANSGSSETGYDRYLLGGQVGGLIVPGSLFSYQFTASANFFDDAGKAFGQATHPDYISHGVRGVIPVAPRQEIEASFDHVETNEAADPFKLRQIIDELSIGYRTALSNFTPAFGDLALGLEAKHEKHKTFFGGSDVADGAVEVYQLYASWSYAWSGPTGRSNISLTGHDSPGGINRRNTAAAFSVFTNGRVDDGDYQYFNLQFSRQTRLPRNWSVSNILIAQYSAGALPDTEQTGLGGADLVRGYSLDDGAYDSGVVLRNELRAPVLPVSTGMAGLQARLSPFAFIDAGYGAARLVLNGRPIGMDIHPVSVGAGADVQFGPHLTANLTGAYAINNAVQTRAGDWRLEARATVTF